jgi:hypothetical protein
MHKLLMHIFFTLRGGEISFPLFFVVLPNENKTKKELDITIFLVRRMLYFE